MTAQAELSVGAAVKLHSLQAKPELNGRSGLIVTALDTETGRLGVRVDGIDKPLALKAANLTAGAAAGASASSGTVDSKALARFVTAHSIRSSEKVKRLFAAEMRAGVALGGSWCCSSSTLWCATCAANLAYSGLEDEVSDNIPKLLGLPSCDGFRGERKLPGELEAAVHVIERVADGRKPLGQVCLENLSEAERAHVRRVGAARAELVCKEYTNAWGMRMLGACVGGRAVASIASLDALAQLYRRAELPKVSREIEEAAAAEGGGAPLGLISEWIAQFDVEENGRRGWLTGLLLGYPVWTTVALYHTGGGGGRYEAW